MSSVYVHIGLPKTGTTHLQDRLWRNRDIALRVADLLYPGNAIDDHFHAAVHLQPGRYLDWVDPEHAKAWPTMVAQMRAWNGNALLSHELFATATAEQVGQLTRDLSFADEIHVVVTVRDLGRQLPSVWQENVKNQRRARLDEFVQRVAAIADDPSLPVGEEGPFWEFQDYVTILKRWEQYVPAERIHIVTVPAKGSSDSLWERFLLALGVDATQLTETVPTANASLSATQTEFLRRLNDRLQPDSIDWARYERIVKGQLIGEILFADAAGPPAELGPAQRDWAAAQASRMIGAVADAGYSVVGTLDDLDVAAESSASTHDGPTQDEVLTVALDLIAELVQRAPLPRVRPRWETKARNVVRRAQRRVTAAVRR
ncbi:sulfotransferase family protein [Gordonia sp. TBRC 11910]|uniref:Sulfotransferase family protein n=1 Tax=Gordonia asplenii TaxID=2725283 RepID=A0A848KT07_9ACTN|nr:sulfotransferase family protein [Gordonia asplenii]NMO01299.1 sulfotransferase family protein [Gordonia asplenii]